MPDFSQLIVKLLGDTSSFDKNFKASQRNLEAFGNAATAVGTRLSAVVTAPIAGLGLAALKAAGQMEQTNVAFKTMLGSAEAAQKHLEGLKQFALSTPFEFNDLTAASKKMQALGFASQEVIPTLRIIGDAAAGLGMGAEGINRITLALGQMKAKGVVSAEEMRQLAEAGIPAWQILANTLKTDVAGAMKLVEQRAVSSATAVPALLEGMNKKFGGLMEAQSKTLLGQWSNFKDKMTFTLVDIGNQLAPTAKRFLEFGDKAGQAALSVVKEFAKLPDPIKDSTIAMAGMAAVAGPLVIVLGQIATSLKAIREAAPFLLALGKAGAVPVGLAVGAGVATSKAQAAAGVNVNSGIGGADPLGIGKALDAENAALKINVQTKLMAGPVNEAALALSLQQAEAHKKNGVAVNDLAFAKKQAAEATRAYTFEERIGLELFNRSHAAGQKVVDTFADLITAGTAWGKKLEYQSAEASSVMFQYQLALRSAGVEAKVAEISTDVYRGTIMEVDAIMRQFGKTGPLALLQTENATRRALERMIELFNAGKATAQQVQAIGQVYAEAVKDRKAGGVATGKDQIQGIRNARQPLLQVSTIITDLSRGLTDLIFKGGKFGDVMKNIALDIGKSLVRNILENGLMKIGSYLGKLVTDHVPALGKVLGSIMGGGASAAGGAISGAGGAAGAASSSMGAVSSGITGMVSAVSGVISAAGSIVQAFQLHGIGKDTGRMEESLRGILNVLALNGSESIHHFAKESMFANVGVRDYWQTTGHTLLVGISGNLDSIASRGMTAAGAGNITIQIQGGIFTADAASIDRLADDLARRIKERLGIR